MHFFSQKHLTLAFLASALLNVVFAGYFCYLYFDESAIRFIHQPNLLAISESRNNLPLTNQDVFDKFQKLSWKSLLKFIEDDRLLEDGIRVQDIATGILEKKHGFDLSRALNHAVPKSRSLIIRDKSLTVYSLSAEDFKAIHSFGKQEKWPLTSEGLFNALKTSQDKSLYEAFALTAVCQHAMSLLKNVNSFNVIEMLKEADWQTASAILNLQGSLEQCRRELLLTYIDKNSVKAAEILLQVDSLYAFKRLDDQHALKVLELLTERNTINAKFALSMLAGPRSDEVKKLAAQRLTSISEKADFVAALSPLASSSQSKSNVNPIPPFASLTKTTKTPSLTPKKEEKTHTVKEGENLWKIARLWKVSVSELQKKNGLSENAILQPGMVLVVP